MLKTSKAITLITLIITIIVLLILAGVTINMVLGENGLFNKAKTSVAKYENAQEKENDILGEYEDLINSILGSRDVDTASLTELINTIVDNKLKAGAGNPTGTIISYMGNTPPTGYLPCDGKDDYLISEHQALADQIKAQFGTYNHFGGDGTTTFAVPDLRGEFLRGTGQSEYPGAGPGGEVGEHQRGSIVNGTYSDGYNFGVAHSHDNIGDSNGFNWGGLQNNVFPDKFYSSGKMRDVGGNVYTTSDSSSMVNFGRYTIRPTNTSVLYCIKE